MKYREYLDTARRHLESCQRFFYSINWSDTHTKERILKDNIETKKEKKELLKDRHKLIMKKDSLIEQINYLESVRTAMEKWLGRRKARIESMRILIRQREDAIEIIDDVKQLKEKKILEDCHYLLTKKASLIEQTNYWKSIRTGMEEWLGRREARIKTKKDLMSQEENRLKKENNKLIVKEEWLKKKQNQLKEKEHLLRDIFYLSGYIFESFIVFKIYQVGYRHVRDVYSKSGKIFNDDEHDIDEFIKEFTEFTKVDYFPRFVDDKSGQVTLKRTHTKIHNGRSLKPDEQEFLKNIEGLCAIEQHKFQKLFKMIQTNKALRDEMFPPSVNIPLFSINTSPEVEKIINRWSSGLRYSDKNLWDKPKKIKNNIEEPAIEEPALKDLVNESTLKDILDICQQINEKIVQF